jgi:hypothetical protein
LHHDLETGKSSRFNSLIKSRQQDNLPKKEALQNEEMKLFKQKTLIGKVSLNAHSKTVTRSSILSKTLASVSSSTGYNSTFFAMVEKRKKEREEKIQKMEEERQKKEAMRREKERQRLEKLEQRLAQLEDEKRKLDQSAFRGFADEAGAPPVHEEDLAKKKPKEPNKRKENASSNLILAKILAEEEDPEQRLEEERKEKERKKKLRMAAKLQKKQKKKEIRRAFLLEKQQKLRERREQRRRELQEKEKKAEAERQAKERARREYQERHERKRLKELAEGNKPPVPKEPVMREIISDDDRKLFVGGLTFEDLQANVKRKKLDPAQVSNCIAERIKRFPDLFARFGPIKEFKEFIAEKRHCFVAFENPAHFDKVSPKTIKKKKIPPKSNSSF